MECTHGLGDAELARQMGVRPCTPAGCGAAGPGTAQQGNAAGSMPMDQPGTLNADEGWDYGLANIPAHDSGTPSDFGPEANAWPSRGSRGRPWWQQA